MRIVCVVSNDLSYDQRMHKICMSMISFGHQVTIVGREKPDSCKLNDFPYNQIRLKLKCHKGYKFYWHLNMALIRFLSTMSIDVLYSVDSDTLVASTIVSKRVKCKLIYDAHEYFSEVPELENKIIKKWIWKTIDKFAIPHCHARITVSEGLKGIFERKYQKKFVVIRNVPILQDSLSFYTDQSKKILIYQGVLNKGRKLKYYIDAMKYLDQNFELHIIGGGDLFDELHEYIVKNDLLNRVFLKGWKKGKELLDETRKSWLGLNLLDSKSVSYQHSLANKFFDYMHAGIPSINSQLPEYKNMIDKTKVGLIVPQCSPEYFAKTISNISVKQWKSMSDNAKEARYSYHWAKEIQILQHILQSLI